MNGGTFNSNPTGTIKFSAAGTNIIEYNSGIFNIPGTVEFNGWHGSIISQVPLTFNNVNVNMGNEQYYLSDQDNVTINGTLTLTEGYLSGYFIAKGDVTVKPTFGKAESYRNINGKVGINNNNNVTIETGGYSPIFMGT
jgi:hypothetical protein